MSRLMTMMRSRECVLPSVLRDETPAARPIHDRPSTALPAGPSLPAAEPVPSRNGPCSVLKIVFCINRLSEYNGLIGCVDGVY